MLWAKQIEVFESLCQEWAGKGYYPNGVIHFQLDGMIQQWIKFENEEDTKTFAMIESRKIQI